jgi:hypothetical protein
MDSEGRTLLQATVGAAVLPLLTDLVDRAGEWFYVYWLARSQAGSAQRPSTSSGRTIVAFATADSAMAFARRNRFDLNHQSSHLQQISLPRLLLLLFNDAAIHAVLLVPDSDPPERAGVYPDGIRLERAALLRQLER